MQTFLLSLLLIFMTTLRTSLWATVIEDKTEQSNSEIKEGMKEILKNREVDQIEKEKEEVRISNKWYRGSNLIYDCQNGSYVCVNDVSFYRCQRERLEDKENARSQLRCSPFKDFKTHKACFDKQYEVIHNQLPKMFCTNPKYL